MENGNFKEAEEVFERIFGDPDSHMVIFFFWGVFFCPFFRAAPETYGGSQARGLIGAVTAGLCSNARSEPCLPPTPQLTATPDP